MRQQSQVATVATINVVTVMSWHVQAVYVLVMSLLFPMTIQHREAFKAAAPADTALTM